MASLIIVDGQFYYKEGSDSSPQLVDGVYQYDDAQATDAYLIVNTVGTTDSIDVFTNVATFSSQSESIGVSDSISVQVEFNRSISESESISDETSNPISRLVLLEESIGTSDTNVGWKGKGAYFYEQVNVYLYFKRITALGEYVTLSENVEITDEISKFYQVNFSEDVGVSDTNISGYGIQPTLTENVGITDSVTGYSGILKKLYNMIDISDNIVAGLPINASLDTELIYITDSLSSSVQIRKEVTITENVDVSDRVSKFIQIDFFEDIGITDRASKFYQIDFAENVGISDIIQSDVISPYVTLSDSIGISDVITNDITSGIVVTLSESVGITDTSNTDEGEYLLDDVYIGDSIITSIGGETFYDVVNTFDSINAIRRRRKIIEIYEDVGVTDNFSIQPSIIISDTVGITDTIPSFVYLEFSENVGVKDRLVKSIVIKENVSVSDTIEAKVGERLTDSIDISDEIFLELEVEGFYQFSTAFHTGGTFYSYDLSKSSYHIVNESIYHDKVQYSVVSVSLSDNVSSFDSISQRKDKGVIFKDNVGVTDTSRRRVEKYIKPFKESISVSDNSIGANFVEKTFFEIIEVEDTISKFIQINFTENVSIIEEFYSGLVTEIDHAESVGITDVLSTFTNTSIQITLTENIGVTDTQAYDQGIQLSESVGITDETDLSRKFFTNSVGITDTLASQTYTGVIYSIADSVGITDTAQTSVEIRITFSESVGITDTVKRTSSEAIVVTISDTVSYTDYLRSLVPIDQLLTFRYGQEVTSESFNALNYGLYPTGIYNGGNFSKIDDYSFEISPATILINDKSLELAITVKTNNSISLDTNISKPYIVFRLEWQNVRNNYVDILTVSSGEILDNDIVVGRCVFSSGLLQSEFDESLRTNPILPDLEDDRFNLKVFATDPVSNTVIVNSGEAYFLNSRVDIITQTSSVVSDTVDGRYDIVYIDTNGNVQIEEGIDSATPEAPSYGGKLVLAEIKRIGTKNVILPNEIFNIDYDKFYPIELSSTDAGKGGSLVGINGLPSQYGDNVESALSEFASNYRVQMSPLEGVIFSNIEKVGYDSVTDKWKQAGLNFSKSTSIPVSGFDTFNFTLFNRIQPYSEVEFVFRDNISPFSLAIIKYNSSTDEFDLVGVIDISLMNFSPTTFRDFVKIDTGVYAVSYQSAGFPDYRTGISIFTLSGTTLSEAYFEETANNFRYNQSMLTPYTTNEFTYSFRESVIGQELQIVFKQWDGITLTDVASLYDFGVNYNLDYRYFDSATGYVIAAISNSTKIASILNVSAFRRNAGVVETIDLVRTPTFYPLSVNNENGLIETADISGIETLNQIYEFDGTSFVIKYDDVPFKSTYSLSNAYGYSQFIGNFIYTTEAKYEIINDEIKFFENYTYTLKSFSSSFFFERSGTLSYLNIRDTEYSNTETFYQIDSLTTEFAYISEDTNIFDNIKKFEVPFKDTSFISSILNIDEDEQVIYNASTYSYHDHFISGYHDRESYSVITYNIWYKNVSNNNIYIPYIAVFEINDDGTPSVIVKEKVLTTDSGVIPTQYTGSVYLGNNIFYFKGYVLGDNITRTIFRVDQNSLFRFNEVTVSQNSTNPLDLLGGAVKVNSIEYPNLYYILYKVGFSRIGISAATINLQTFEISFLGSGDHFSSTYFTNGEFYETFNTFKMYFDYSNNIVTATTLGLDTERIGSKKIRSYTFDSNLITVTNKDNTEDVDIPVGFNNTSQVIPITSDNHYFAVISNTNYSVYEMTTLGIVKQVTDNDIRDELISISINSDPYSNYLHNNDNKFFMQRSGENEFYIIKGIQLDRFYNSLSVYTKKVSFNIGTNFLMNAEAPAYVYESFYNTQQYDNQTNVLNEDSLFQNRIIFEYIGVTKDLTDLKTNEASAIFNGNIRIRSRLIDNEDDLTIGSFYELKSNTVPAIIKKGIEDVTDTFGLLGKAISEDVIALNAFQGARSIRVIPDIFD